MELTISPTTPSADCRPRGCSSAARHQLQPPASGRRNPGRSAPLSGGRQYPVGWRVVEGSGAFRSRESKTEAPALVGAGLRARMRFRGASRAEENGVGRRDHPPGSRPGRGRVIPKSICATSDRPAPTRPKKPRISPDRTSKLTFWTKPAPESPRTVTTGNPICASSFGKKAPGSVPIM